MLHCYKNEIYKKNEFPKKKETLKSNNINYQLLLHVKVLKQFIKHKEQRQLDSIY